METKMNKKQGKRGKNITGQRRSSCPRRVRRLSATGNPLNIKLVQCTKRGDTKAIKALISEKADVNAKNLAGQTVLHWAAHSGHAECVMELVKRNAIVDSIDDAEHRTPLALAARHGHVECVRTLLHARAAVDSTSGSSDETPLIKASRYNHIETTEVLLEARANVNQRDTMWQETALFKAAGLGYDAICSMLIEHNADLNSQNEMGDSALHVASREGHDGVVYLLVGAGADPSLLNAKLLSPADIASNKRLKQDLSKYAAVKILKELTDKGILSWSPHDVGAWVGAVGHPEYAGVFVGNHIDGRMLVQLDMTSMKSELGITSMGHRKHLTDHLNALKGKGSDNSSFPSSSREDIADIEYSDLVFYTGTLGKGHFGEVKRARWFGTDVAVKSIYRDAYHADFSLFEKEVRILSKLRHPNVILIIGITRSPEGRPCIITEYLSRGSLYSLIHDCPFTLNKVGLRHSIVSDVAKGMAYLHGNKPEPILHRDLTSHNLLLDSKLMAKVADFGLSRVKQDASGGRTYGVGQIPWMAPEVLQGLAYTTAADVYSFGCIVYELMVLHTPHNDADPEGYAAMVRAGKRPSIPEHVPVHWVTLIQACWIQDVASRPSFVSLLHMLDNMTDEEVGAGMGHTVPSRPSIKTSSPPPTTTDGYI